MHILGITGGIATGKSTVTRMFADLGAPTVSADTIARALLAPGTLAAQAVLAAFPSCADKSGLGINRRTLAEIIFGDPLQRARLEALTHPAIIETLQAQIAEWRASDSPRAGAAEIPLLFEAELEWLVDRTVVVACAESVQGARLCARDGIDAAEAQRQIAAQWPLTEKITLADTIITTDDGLEETRRQVRALWESL